MAGLQSAMVARGADKATAMRGSLATIFGMVERQAAILSFIDVFQLLTVLFLLAAPLVFLMKKPPKRAGGMPVH